MAHSIVPTVIPTGGAVSLTITSVGSGMTLSRSDGGSGVSAPWMQIYTGVPTPIFIDVGDGLMTPLSSGTSYYYKIDDDEGPLISAPVTPILQLNIQQEPMTPMIMKLLQAGIDNLVVPSPINKATRVLHAMPLGGLPTLPIITINMDMVQQVAVPIGQSVEKVSPDGVWTISGLINRVYHMTVLADNPEDREFYKDAVVAIMQSIIASVMVPIGDDVSHKFQAAAGQVANDPSGMGPGFYYADILWTFEGNYNISIDPVYGSVNVINVTAQYGGASDTVTISGI